MSPTKCQFAFGAQHFSLKWIFKISLVNQHSLVSRIKYQLCTFLKNLIAFSPVIDWTVLFMHFLYRSCGWSWGRGWRWDIKAALRHFPAAFVTEKQDVFDETTTRQKSETCRRLYQGTWKQFNSGLIRRYLFHLLIDPACDFFLEV